MIIKVKKINISELSDCLNSSSLKENYFTNSNYIEEFLTESINRGELYSYMDNGKAIAFMRIDPVGMFSKFPLLRCIAVNPDYRNRGIGKMLLQYFENLYTDKNNKIFLCVSDFNAKAKRLYIKSGYIEVGKISGLYKDHITEYLLCKTLKYN